MGLAAAARSRFGAANPLTEIDLPWRWDLDRLGDAVSQPLRDDAVVNLLIRSSLTVIWLALAVIAVTIVTEVVHMIRHHGLPAPDVRGVGWAQRIGRWVAVGLIALLPVNSFTSTANAVGDTGPAATAQRLGLVTGDAVAAATRRQPADTGRHQRRRHSRLDISPGTRIQRTVPEHPTIRRTQSTPTPASAVHVVQRGESIYAIAAGYAGGDEITHDRDRRPDPRPQPRQRDGRRADDSPTLRSSNPAGR